MTERKLEQAEREIFEITRSLHETARLIKDADPDAARAIRYSFTKLHGLHATTDDTDEGDRELLRACGKYLAEVARALQAL